MAREGVRRDRVTYNAVIVALQGAGQWERARGVLQQAVSDGAAPKHPKLATP
jgi:pentatricopeptide repeat protein